MGNSGDEIFLSRARERGWHPDGDIGGQAALLLQYPATRAGLWRAGPEPAVPIPPVEIPQRETIYVIEGRVRIGVSDDESFDLGPGDMISIPAHAMVAWDPSDDCQVFWVYS